MPSDKSGFLHELAVEFRKLLKKSKKKRAPSNAEWHGAF